MGYNKTDIYEDGTDPFYVKTSTGDMTAFPSGGSGNVPVGGTAGQLLAKIDSTDYNSHWVTPPSGGAGIPSIVDYGAVGDGTTDDTAAIQAAITAHDTVYIPPPSVSYKCSNVQLRTNTTLWGEDQWRGEPDQGTGHTTFLGFGGDPIFVTGAWPSGVNTDNRNITLRGSSMRNTGAPCVDFLTANNPTIENVYAVSYSHTDASSGTIRMRQSPRGNIRNCDILNSGGAWAINMMDNCNAMNLTDIITTGGSAGGAINIGQCQRVSMKGITIEESLLGIRVGSDSTTGHGICSVIHADDIYMEGVGSPYQVGLTDAVYGFNATNQFINGLTTSFTEDYLYNLGNVLDWNIEGILYSKSGGSKEFIQFQQISSNYPKGGNTRKINFNPGGSGANFKYVTVSADTIASYNEIYPLLGDADSGHYTPTLTNTTNISASTAYTAHWSRKDNIITVSGQVDIDAISTGSTQLGISLPVASTFTSFDDASGTAASAYIAGMSAGFIADSTNHRVVLQFISIDTANRTWQYIYSYQVI